MSRLLPPCSGPRGRSLTVMKAS